MTRRTTQVLIIPDNLDNFTEELMLPDLSQQNTSELMLPESSHEISQEISEHESHRFTQELTSTLLQQLTPKESQKFEIDQTLTRKTTQEAITSANIEGLKKEHEKQKLKQVLKEEVKRQLSLGFLKDVKLKNKNLKDSAATGEDHISQNDNQIFANSTA